MAGFFEEHNAREAELEAKAQADARARTLAARHPQNAAALCFDCGQVKADTLLGVCGACFTAWEACH